MNTNTVIGYILIAIIIVAAAWYFFFANPNGVSSGPQQGTDQSAAASTAVTQFGDQLQKVSLLAPDATSTMASAYGPYVTPALLAQWEASTSSAPGKTVSSPWPDHIEVAGSTQQSDGSYLITGDIVLMTSTGNAGTIPFSAIVTNANGTWLISDFSMSPIGGVPVSTSTPTTTGS
ncbi:MAG TPA: hypothetical protein VFL98_02475 [Candidatus Paceibacterota bacterium]|nr:hypothetical protein [Candidatus Paceibacterota bacterium]